MAKTKLLRPGEIAEMFDVHVGTVRRWLSDGLIPAIRTPGGQYRIDPEEARKALESSPSAALTEQGRAAA